MLLLHSPLDQFDVTRILESLMHTPWGPYQFIIIAKAEYDAPLELKVAFALFPSEEFFYNLHSYFNFMSVNFYNDLNILLLALGWFMLILTGLYFILVVTGSALQKVGMFYFFLFGIFTFIKELIAENLSSKYVNMFFFLILSVFLALVLSNLTGMVPYSFTVTSHFVITFTLSFSLFIGITLTGLLVHGQHFITLFIPKGAPSILLPFLMLIEVISYMARPFSLGIRLFANIMAGHTLLKILSFFAFFLLTQVSNGTINLSSGVAVIFYTTNIICLHVFLFLLIIAIIVLELCVAILQAYVFIMLLVLYYNDSINLH